MGVWAFSGDSRLHSVSEQLMAGTQRRMALSGVLGLSRLREMDLDPRTNK